MRENLKSSKINFSYVPVQPTNEREPFSTHTQCTPYIYIIHNILFSIYNIPI